MARVHTSRAAAAKASDPSAEAATVRPSIVPRSASAG